MSPVVAFERDGGYTPRLVDVSESGTGSAAESGTELVSESGTELVSDSASGPEKGGATLRAAHHADAVDGFEAALDRLCGIRLDELGDEQLTAELAVLETSRRRLSARIARATATITGRAERRAKRATSGAGGIGEGRRAAAGARRQLADELGWSPRDVNRIDEDGRALEKSPAAAAAADRGELTPRHARILAHTLRYLKGHPARGQLEAELISVAATQDPITFSKTARRRLGEIAPDALKVDHDLRQQRRRATVTESDDGMLRLEGLWTGLDAETIATAVHAFRRPDHPDGTRTAGQRTADAVVEMARAALDAARAPTDRGARPHVNLTVPIGLLEKKAGIAEGSWTGPICYETLRAVLDDVGLGWIVTDRGGLPVEAGPEVRTVPAGLWRLLVQRDRGCIREGCDIPAPWTDVMHLDRSFADGGRLSPDNAALGCRADHRLYDTGRLALHWNDGRPTLRPRDPRQARDGPSP